jgi:hypothetical protein
MRTLGECVCVDILRTQLGFPQRRPNRQRLPNKTSANRFPTQAPQRTIFLACAS